MLFCQVTVPGQVVDVACGVDHMVALVKSLLWALVFPQQWIKGWMFNWTPPRWPSVGSANWAGLFSSLEASCSPRAMDPHVPLSCGDVKQWAGHRRRALHPAWRSYDATSLGVTTRADWRDLVIFSYKTMKKMLIIYYYSGWSFFSVFITL